MKKTLVMLLAVAMVASLCGMMFVSADSANLAAGKEVANAKLNGSNANYSANLTDGVVAEAISSEAGIWFGYYYNADLDADKLAEMSNTNADGVAIPTIDLGAACALESVRMHIVDNGDWGILAPTSAIAQVSNDGETFTDVATVTEFTTGVTWVEFDLSGQTARYVRIAIDLNSVWFFLDEIEVYGVAAGDDEPDSSEDAPSEEPSEEPSEDASSEPSEPAKTYEDTLVKGEDGNYSCEVPYGYTWTVSYVDGKIVGEDVTICTTDEAYKACNPNWAITILAELQEDGTYVAVQDAVATPGNADAVTVGENQIAIVVHSAASNPDPDKDGNTYANWKSKVVAMAVKTGDVFTVNEDKTAVYAVIPGESIEDTSEPPKTGDAGILVFAVLGVVAICGAAVAIKARG